MNKYGIDIRKDLYYIRGEKEGIEKGIEKGLEKGLEKGVEKGKIITNILAIDKMLISKFSYEIISTILLVKINFIKKIEIELKQKTKVIELLSKGELDNKKIAKKLKVSEIFVDAFEYFLNENNSKN